MSIRNSRNSFLVILFLTSIFLFSIALPNVIPAINKPTNGYTVGESVLVENLWDFFLQEYYDVTMTVRAVTQHSVFLSDNLGVQADKFATQFELDEYPWITNFIGPFPDIDSDGLVHVVITDIRDAAYHGSTAGTGVGGYFSSGIAQYEERVTLDLNTIRTQKPYTNYTDSATLVHELQHL